MPRPRTQTGELHLYGKGSAQYWSARFWCDVVREDGTKDRQKRSFVLGLKSGMSERVARAKLFALINERQRAYKFRIVASGPHETNVDVKCRGSYAEYVAALDLMRRGFEVFRAMNHSASCDLVVIKGKDQYRVEVKFVGLKHRYIQPSERFDILATVSTDSSVEYRDSRGVKIAFESADNWRRVDETKELKVV